MTSTVHRLTVDAVIKMARVDMSKHLGSTANAQWINEQE